MHQRLVQVAQCTLPMPPMAQVMQWHKYRTQDPGLMWLRGLMHRAVLRMDGAEAAWIGAATGTTPMAASV